MPRQPLPALQGGSASLSARQPSSRRSPMRSATEPGLGHVSEEGGQLGLAYFQLLDLLFKPEGRHAGENGIDGLLQLAPGLLKLWPPSVAIGPALAVKPVISSAWARMACAATSGDIIRSLSSASTRFSRSSREILQLLEQDLLAI